MPWPTGLECGRRHNDSWWDRYLQLLWHLICRSAHAMAGGLGLHQTTQRRDRYLQLSRHVLIVGFVLYTRVLGCKMGIFAPLTIQMLCVLSTARSHDRFYCTHPPCHWRGETEVECSQPDCPSPTLHTPWSNSPSCCWPHSCSLLALSAICNRQPNTSHKRNFLTKNFNTYNELSVNSTNSHF